jgi:dTDP-4-amino-4,6-dideoxygalactose transaminase
MVSLIAWGMKNKKVASTNYGYVASANQAALLNDVEFFDVDKKGLINIEEEFTHDLVIPVSLYGNTIDYDNLRIGANTKIIVDAAQSLGTKYKGKPDGSFGDAAIFSFARNKPVPTAGTHGAIVWDDDAITDKILSASMNGKLSRNGGIVSHGVNATPYELQAAQIDIGLDHMGEWQVKRKLIHEYYCKEFADLPFDIIKTVNLTITSLLCLWKNEMHLQNILMQTTSRPYYTTQTILQTFLGQIKSFPIQK